MKRKFFVPIFFMALPFMLQAADSTSNKKGQTLRICQEYGIHLMYLTTSPIVIEFPGKNWMFGFARGSGKYSYSYVDSFTIRT